MIGDLISKATVVFDADTKALKLALKDLQGEEKKLAEQQLAQSEARNKQLDAWKEKMTTVITAVGLTALAGKALWEGWEHNVRKAQLATNAAGLDIERLRKGFGGLRTEMQALETANALANSKFKLTGEQMETVGKAMRQLVREGHDWDEVNKKVTDSFVKLNGGGLDDFGIHVREATTDSSKFSAILEAMTEKSLKLGDSTKTSAEKMQGFKTSFTDSMDQVKQSLGEIAVALAPVVDLVAKLVGVAAQTLSSMSIANQLEAHLAKYGSAWGDSPTATTSATTRRLVGARTGTGAGDDLNLAEVIGGGFTKLNQLAYAGNEWLGEFIGKAGKKRSGPSARDKYWNKIIEEMLGGADLGQRAPDDYEMAPWALEDSPTEGYGFAKQPEIPSSLLENIANTKDWNARLGDVQAAHQSKLEGIFGPLEDFDAYKTAFETLNGAIGSAFSAWIDGSTSAGVAFKKFIGEALKGVAVQMAMESIKHAAYAIGSLAFGNFAGAAMHGKAAASFAAGAVLVGASAKALHSSGGGAPTSAGAGSPGGGVPAYSGGSADSGAGGNHTTIVYGGPDFHGSSDRQRMLAAKRITNLALVAGENGGVNFR